MSAIVCGLPVLNPVRVLLDGDQPAPRQPDCQEDLVRTHRPASTLWCPVHGHVVEVLPPPPLRGVAIVCGPGGESSTIDLADLARG